MLFNLFFYAFILIFLPIIEINCGKNLGPVNLFFFFVRTEAAEYFVHCCSSPLWDVGPVLSFVFLLFSCIPWCPPCSLLFETYFTTCLFSIQYYILWMWRLVEKDCSFLLRTRCWSQLLSIFFDNSMKASDGIFFLSLVYQCYIAAWLLQQYMQNVFEMVRGYFFCRMFWNGLYVAMGFMRQNWKIQAIPLV